ncbi:MAG: hypothetical protein GY714_18020 [Desulfobacterales bacterium]|nr:hypothetical protein [Desulfobacterales bacterium]
MATSSNIGRPLKYKTVEEIEPLIEKYFDDCKKNEDPYTVTGLAYALDTSRKTLMEYEGRSEFSNTIKKAKDRCELYAEKKLYKGGSVAGVIFSMKNNYGWTDNIKLDADVKTKKTDLTHEEIDKLIEEKQESIKQIEENS